MDGMEQVSHLIGEIYDASLDPTLWPEVLEQTCGFVQGIASVLIAHEATTRAGHFYFSWGDDPLYTESYNQTFSLINPLIVPILVGTRVGDVVLTGLRLQIALVVAGAGVTTGFAALIALRIAKPICELSRGIVQNRTANRPGLFPPRVLCHERSFL